MHQVSASADDPLKNAPDVPAHQDRAYEFVECPMRAASGVRPTLSDINPANMVCVTFKRIVQYISILSPWKKVIHV